MYIQDMSDHDEQRGEKVAWESFDGCMHENNMEGLCQSITEMTLGNQERENTKSKVVVKQSLIITPKNPFLGRQEAKMRM